jgi:orotate phosphoribosyltransferase
MTDERRADRPAPPTPGPAAGEDALAQDFVRFAVQAGVLRFGEFKTKAGRLSPYFFNAGGFDDGAKLGGWRANSMHAA